MNEVSMHAGNATEVNLSRERRSGKERLVEAMWGEDRQNFVKRLPR